MALRPLTYLELSGIGVPPYSARGVVQTYEPIAQAGSQLRTVDGVLINLGREAFQKYKTTISCADQQAPACDGVWAGQVVTVKWAAELCYRTTSGGGGRTAVSGSERVDGDFTFYRPEMEMQVTGFSVDYDEMKDAASWRLELEEI